uniref:Interleukin-17 receptor C/E N-terminal domain-containing protein n=1 Tax=Nothobranchius furzeri TaxID=105023 RepID=A0A8C6KF63_NOTFU
RIKVVSFVLSWSDWFSPGCQIPAEGLSSSVFQHVNISTVMKCERKQKCTLHLKVQTLLLLSGGNRLIDWDVENDCTEVSPNQQLQVTVKTIPDYCNISWTTTYLTPESVFQWMAAILFLSAGRLSYVENPEKKELEIHVSDMLEGHDYHLRLCHKDFICLGTGAKTLMHKEKSNKSAILQYSRPLPCLCIEGWSAVMDAPRVQVCPFKDRLEELWFKITFDSAEEALTWKPACPISAVAGLCEKREDGNCMDLPDSLQNVSRERLTFAKVDPHPDLCMKVWLISLFQELNLTEINYVIAGQVPAFLKPFKWYNKHLFHIITSNKLCPFTKYFMFFFHQACKTKLGQVNELCFMKKLVLLISV